MAFAPSSRLKTTVTTNSIPTIYGEIVIAFNRDKTATYVRITPNPFHYTVLCSDYLLSEMGRRTELNRMPEWLRDERNRWHFEKDTTRRFRTSRQRRRRRFKNPVIKKFSYAKFVRQEHRQHGPSTNNRNGRRPGRRQRGRSAK